MARRVLVASPTYFAGLHRAKSAGANVYLLAQAIWDALETTENPLVNATGVEGRPGRWELQIMEYSITFEPDDDRIILLSIERK